MEIISIERSTYEELLTSFNSFVSQMKAMGSRGTDKRLVHVEQNVESTSHVSYIFNFWLQNYCLLGYPSLCKM